VLQKPSPENEYVHIPLLSKLNIPELALASRVSFETVTLELFSTPKSVSSAPSYELWLESVSKVAPLDVMSMSAPQLESAPIAGHSP